MSSRRSFPKNVFLALALAVAAGSVMTSTGCGGSSARRKGKSEARKWIDNPTSGKREGSFIKIPQIGLEFEIPDTLYVFKNCEEASHTASSSPEKNWVAVVSCSSTGTTSSDEDLGASSDESEMIALNFYLAPKERPVDERAVAYYRNQYQQAGLNVEELAFNDDYFDKTGIFAKLQVVDESGNALREIQQFMFPYGDVLYIARTEYPFGDTRAIQQDWKSIMPYFRVSLNR